MERIDFRENEVILNEAQAIHHVVIVPIYTEPLGVIEENIRALLATEYQYPENVTIILATEERAPKAQEYATLCMEKYKDAPMKIINIVHPSGIPGEGKVK